MRLLDLSATGGIAFLSCFFLALCNAWLIATTLVVCEYEAFVLLSNREFTQQSSGDTPPTLCTITHKEDHTGGAVGWLPTFEASTGTLTTKPDDFRNMCT